MDKSTESVRGPGAYKLMMHLVPDKPMVVAGSPDVVILTSERGFRYWEVIMKDGDAVRYHTNARPERNRPQITWTMRCSKEEY